ncbi:MAG: hypothetical protein ACK5LK_05380, partial [Chthoniobacterales bacterium]
NWGKQQGADIDWIPNDKKLLTQAIKESFFWPSPEIWPQLLSDAKKIKLFNVWIVRLQFAIRFKLLQKKMPPEATWIKKSAYLL